MSNDATPIRLTKTGTMTLSAEGIAIDGFEGENCSCRDVAILACLWAIGQLQMEATATVHMPGGGRASVD